MEIISDLKYCETNLTLNDFKDYFEKSKLGELFFPVGEAYGYDGGFAATAYERPFFIQLDELYRLITGWKINNQDVLISEILAVVAFGSAVGPVEDYVKYTRRKYFLWGEKIKCKAKQTIYPNDADFLIITTKNKIEEKVLKAVNINIYGVGTCIEKGGIHLVNRSMEQCVNGAVEGDTITINGLSKGIPIFCDREFISWREKIDLPDKSLYNGVCWNVNKRGILRGTIG